MEEEGNTSGQTSSIPAYSVDYVLDHYEELDGQEMYVEGYISSIRNDKYWHGIYMVSTSENILGLRISATDSTNGYIDVEAQKQKDYQAILLSLGNEEFGMEPGDMIRARCTLTVREEDPARILEGAVRLLFDAKEFIVLRE